MDETPATTIDERLIEIRLDGLPLDALDEWQLARWTPIGAFRETWTKRSVGKSLGLCNISQRTVNQHLIDTLDFSGRGGSCRGC